MFTWQLGVDLLLFIISVFFLVRGTTILIESLNNMSRSTKLELFALTGLFSAVATSLPELVVSLSSALASKSNLALGLVMGSNIANITLVIGSVAFLGGSLSVAADFVSKDVLKAFGAVTLPLVLLIDGRLSRIDGMILLLAFLLYHFTVFYRKHKYTHQLKESPFTHVGRFLHRFSQKYQHKQLGWFLLGIIMLLFSADMMVQVGSRMAIELNLPIILVGIFFVAIGTSLPELAFEIKAVKSKQINMVFGDLLGSLVANSTLILGVVAVISPIVVASSMKQFVHAAWIFVLGFLLLWLFLRTKFKLQRWEGAVLLSLYLVFFLVEFTQLG